MAQSCSSSSLVTPQLIRLLSSSCRRTHSASSLIIIIIARRASRSPFGHSALRLRVAIANGRRHDVLIRRTWPFYTGVFNTLKGFNFNCRIYGIIWAKLKMPISSTFLAQF